MRNDKDARSSKKIQGHGCDLCCVLVPVLDRQARGNHVTVVDSLHLDTGYQTNFIQFLKSVLYYLVDIVTVNSCIKKLIQRVQKGHNLSEILQ